MTSKVCTMHQLDFLLNISKTYTCYCSTIMKCSNNILQFIPSYLPATVSNESGDAKNVILTLVGFHPFTFTTFTFCSQ